MRFVIARSVSKRPTLMHVIRDRGITECGLLIAGWSVAYLAEPIPQVMCLKCKHSIRVRISA